MLFVWLLACWEEVVFVILFLVVSVRRVIPTAFATSAKLLTRPIYQILGEILHCACQEV